MSVRWLRSTCHKGDTVVVQEHFEQRGYPEILHIHLQKEEEELWDREQEGNRLRKVNIGKRKTRCLAGKDAIIEDCWFLSSLIF